MNRRTFIATVAALACAPALPAHSTARPVRGMFTAQRWTAQRMMCESKDIADLIAEVRMLRMA